jgi:hypothetical protein
LSHVSEVSSSFGYLRSQALFQNESRKSWELKNLLYPDLYAYFPDDSTIGHPFGRYAKHKTFKVFLKIKLAKDKLNFPGRNGLSQMRIALALEHFKMFYLH